MNTSKFLTMAYLGIGVGLVRLSFVSYGWSKHSALVCGIGFLLVAALFFCSLKLRWRWLTRVTDFIQRIRVTHISVLIILAPLGLALIQRQDVILGILVLYIAVIYYSWVMGGLLAEAFLPLVIKKKRKGINES
jgi:hypothetical protein